MRSVACLLVLLASAGCDRTQEGTRAYRDGRFRDAFAAYSRAAQDAGDGATAELRFDEALAALRADEPSAADAAAEKASGGDPAVAALAGFLRGNVAFARAETAERQAAGPEAEPFALDVAIAYADAARRHWQTAATTRDDWPEARRNVERAHLLVERLKAKKARSDPKSRPEARPRPVPAGEKKKPADAPQSDPNAASSGTKGAGAQSPTEEGELAPGDVTRLLDLLAERDRKKLSVRRERRDTTANDVEKDW